MVAPLSALAGANILLLALLTAVWARNCRTKTTLVLGLIAFAVATLVENALALYFLSMQSRYPGDPYVQQASSRSGRCNWWRWPSSPTSRFSDPESDDAHQKVSLQS